MKVHLEANPRALRDHLGYDTPVCLSDSRNRWGFHLTPKTTNRRDRVTCGNCKRTHLYRRTKGGI